jgi:hypothetical protein
VTEHTPTPWSFNGTPHYELADGDVVVDITRPVQSYVLKYVFRDEWGRRTTVYLAEVLKTAGRESEAAANAAFIVEAVNNHEALKAEITRLRSELEQARGAVDVLERNASVQANLLADTGRELEQAKWLVEEAAGHLRYLADKLGMIHGCDCEDCAQISSAKSFLAALPSTDGDRT